jgi:hypothetical protein
MSAPRFLNSSLHSAWREGWHSVASSPCPYGMDQLGPRCAWLAAHRDRYGSLAA